MSTMIVPIISKRLKVVTAIYISARERKILEILLETEGEITIGDLANELDVSPRTVHRDLKGIEDILREYQLSLKKKSGSGIQIAGENQQKKDLHLYLFNLSHNEYTPEERQTIVLTALLEAKEPVKLIALANDLNVTIATISNDLNKVEERLEKVCLTLIRKRGYGVELEGSESSKRRAMSSLILKHLDEFEFLSMIKESIQNKSRHTIDSLTDRLLGLVDKKKLLIIEKQVEEIRDTLPYSIADSAYIGLVVHLTLAIERIQQGENINFDQDYLDDLKDTKEYQVAEKIVSGLEKVFGLTIPNSEIGYITMHLMGAKLRNHQDHSLEETSFQVGMKAQELIRFVGNEINQDLTGNLSLFKGLVSHLRPAIFRITQNMGISNPLLQKIEADYHELFSILEEGVKRIFPEYSVPKEEIGYLVMHFASALLGNDDESEMRALVVCSSGIGTSKILSTKLRKEIPGLKTIENASMFDIQADADKDYDVIISTIPLKNFSGDYIQVSPILSEAETEKIKSFLKAQMLKEKKSSIIEKPIIVVKNNQEIIGELKEICNYSSAIVTLLEGIQLEEIHEPFTKEEVLKRACDDLSERSVVLDAGQVLEHLLAREHSGGLGIPDTSLALYHTRSHSVTVPSFTLYRVSKPILVEAMDQTLIEMKTMLLMLAPEELNDQALEVLSEISTLIIRDQESVKFFETGGRSEIVTYLTQELNSFFEIKMKEIRSRSK